MSQFDNLLTDKVSLLKKDGTKEENIKASVQKNKIFIHRSDLLIESGDLILRKMSNGAEETFKVIDPGFREKFHSINAHYQMDVKKLGLDEAKNEYKNITYNISGNNARINQNSVDNSINIININPDLIEKIELLKNEIEKTTSDVSEKKNHMETIEAIETQIKAGKNSKNVISTLLSTLPTVGNIASISSLILSLL